jgi:glucose-1-phosphate adenylyltransferase
MSGIIAMVLAGGRVGELGVLTFYRPKSTLPFGGLYRIIDFPLSNLMNSGIERVGILSQYRSSSLIEHIGLGSPWDMIGRHRGITLLPPFQGMHAADWYKGTADALYQNLDFIEASKPKAVIIISGDHIYEMDYNELIRFHKDTGADVTAAFVEIEKGDMSRFGQAVISDDDPRGGKVLSYQEKPIIPISKWVSMTVYVFKPEILKKLLIENIIASSHELGRDILPVLTNYYNFYGYKFKGHWAYSRTLDEYWTANMDTLGENPALNIDKMKLRTNLDHEAIRDRDSALIGKNAGINNARVYNGVKVEGKVENSILFPGVMVEEGAEVKDSILFFDTHIGPGVKIAKTITDIGVSIGKSSIIGSETGELTTVGINTRIPKNISIGSGCSVHPNLMSEDFKINEYGNSLVISRDGHSYI